MQGGLSGHAMQGTHSPDFSVLSVKVSAKTPRTVFSRKRPTKHSDLTSVVRREGPCSPGD